MRYFHKIVRQQIAWWFCCLSFVTLAQTKTITPEAEVSVLTCGQGDDLYALFGHTALRIKDKSQNIDWVFNYGMFDFDTPHFYTKFVKGNLKYHLDVDYYYDFIRYYSYKNRTVTEQKIHLSFEEKKVIWDKLWEQLYSDDRYYHYQFIENNCTTKIVDLLQENTQYTLNTDFESNNKTYRELLNTYLHSAYFPQLGINLIFGKKVDRDNHLLFLPEQLLQGVHFTPQLEKTQEVLYLSTVDRSGKISFDKWIFFLALFILAWCAKYASVRKIYFVVASLLGTFVLLVQLYSNHMELNQNPMVFFYNPLYLLAIFSFQNKKILFSVISLSSIISLFFLSLEAIYILLPLVILHIVFIVKERKAIQ